MLTIGSCVSKCRAVVSDVCGPPKIIHTAELLPQLNLDSSVALGLSICDEGGLWDFNKARVRRKAWVLLTSEGPALLIGIPPRTLFSSRERLNKHTL